jgi:benzoyl-CoA reductase/2-hydroxyglutaryl-CoA dehydratase subunit BcrC/BadD/HgdB
MFQSQLDYLMTGHKLPAITRVFDLALTYIQRADAAHKRGQKVVYGGGVSDSVIIHALDVFPCVYNELGRLAGDDSVALAEDYFQIPRETCSMIKAMIGELLKRKHSFRRLIAYSSLCEPFNTAFEVLKDEGFDVYTVDLPYKPAGLSKERFESLVDFAEAELKGLVSWLGGNLDEERLHYEIKRINRIHRKVRRILELQVANPDYMETLETMFLWNGANHNYGAPKEYEEICDELIEQLEEVSLIKREINKVPLVWAGGRGQEFGLFKLIDDLGGYIASWTMTGGLLRDYNEDMPPLRAIAYNIVFGLGGPGGSRERLPFLEKSVQASKARGIIFYGYFGCSFTSVNFEVARNYFSKKGIQSLILLGSFQIGEPSGQSITRLKAFMEMVK